jgi:PAS domain S-box-containing protein
MDLSICVSLKQAKQFSVSMGFNYMAFLTKEPILQKIIMYVLMCCSGITVMVGLNSILEYKVNQFSNKEANEQSKNTLSLFVQKRVLIIQNQFQYMLLASSKMELELANQFVEENLSVVRKAIEVLTNGGELKETFFVNFGNREYIDQVIVYHPVKNTFISLSAIEMKTNMIRLEELRKDYYHQLVDYLNQKSDSSDRSHTYEVTLFHKKIAPFFQRTLENSNRLYFESLNALNRASLEKNQQIRVYETLSGIVAVIAMLSTIFLGIRISRGIKVILEERKSAKNALLATNENLESLVLERTESLRAEVQERRLAQAQISSQAEFLTTVIESFNHPFYAINIDTYEIEIANQAARNFHQEAKTLCHELTHHRETPCDGAEHPCPIQLIRETQKDVVLEHIHYDMNGNPLNVEVHACPIFNESGEIKQIIEYSLDITEKKKAQIALKKSRDELEDLVVQRTHKLEREIQRRTEAQEKLEKSERHFRKLIENINDIILIADKNGYVKFVSSSASRVLGYTPEEITGQKIFKFIHPDEFKGENQLVRFLAFAKKGTRAEHRILNKEGEYRIMESSLRFMVDDPDIGGIIFTSRDVTDRKKTEQMQRQLMLVVEQTPNTIVITNIQGEIEYVNPAFVETTGYQYEEAIGQNPKILNSGKVSDEVFSEMWASLEKGKPWKGEFINKNKSGALYNENVVVAPLRDDTGTITHYVAIKENITELVQARKMAEAATRAKSEFLANMSHEIRTPMNAIIGMSYLCLSTDLNPRQRDYIEKVHHSSQLLLRIINDILDFSKIEAGKLDVESTPFELEDVYNNLSNLVSANACDKGLEFIIVLDPDVPDRLLGDPLRLGQVLVNLTNNAIKFTETGHVTVRTEMVKKENQNITLRFLIQDTGIGMTSAETSRLFKAFSQADASTTRKFGGTGLGLTISKRLIELMGGQIWVESQPDVGSTFYFTAVFQKQSSDSPIFQDVSMELEDQQILIVDDSEDARDMMVNLARKFSLNVQTASSGNEAILLINKALNHNQLFDLVLMDYQMPGMNGIETIQQIHDDPEILTPKMVLVSERPLDEILPEIQIDAFSGVMIKPVLQGAFYETIICGILGICDPEIHQKGGIFDIKPEGLSSIAGAKVLLVEDNTINQQVATELLEQAQIIVNCANNGKEAVDTVISTTFDAVFMDVHMPLIDGYEATQIIRRDDRFKKLPIIAMTASTMAGDREKCLHAGMNDHLGKPIDPKELYTMLVKWIKPDERAIPDTLKNRRNIATDQSIPVLPGFDVSRGIARLGGNINVYRKALEKFIETEAQTIERIRQCVKSGDIYGAELIAHSLKGVAGNIGANELSSVAGDLETVLTDNTTDLFETRITALAQHLSDAITTIKSALEDNTSLEIETSADISFIHSILDNLKTEIENYSASASKTCDTLIDLLKGSPAKSAAVSLGKALDAYDFDQTQVLFDKLIEKINKTIKSDIEHHV